MFLYFLTLPFIKKITGYQEKIMILCSRIYESEIKHEIEKNEQFIQILQKTDDSVWVFKDFNGILKPKEQEKQLKSAIKQNIVSQKIDI